MQHLKKKEDVHKLLQLLLLNKGKKKIAKSKAAGNIDKIAVLPGAVEKLSGKVKNKRLKKILNSQNVKKIFNYGADFVIKNYSKNLLQ